MRKLWPVLLCVVLLLPHAAKGADDQWEVFLSADFINRFAPDGDSLWCCTKGGLLLFDLRDSSFTHFADGLEFWSNDVTSMTIDDRGSVWVGFASTGINRIDNIDGEPVVRHYGATIEGLVSDNISSLVSVGDDVYYGSSNGVAKFFSGQPTDEVNLTDSLAGKQVYDLLVVEDTLLWVGYAEGVALYNRRNFGFTSFPLGRITSLCIHDGFVHCAGDGGVQRFDGGAWSGVGALGDVPLSVSSGGGVLACVTIANAFTWSGTDWTDITGNMKELFDDDFNIPQNFDILRAVSVDARGTPWIGCGVARGMNRGTYVTGYIDGVWRNWMPELISHSRVIELDIGSQGLWLSTRYYGISLLTRSGRWIVYKDLRSDDPQDRGLSFYFNHLAMLFDSQGYLWSNVLAFDLDRVEVNDIFNRDDDEWEHFSLGEGTIESNRFVKAKEDPAGNRWFCSDDDQKENEIWGINIASADGTDFLTVNPSIVTDMASGSVFDCAFASGGRAYLALRGYGVQLWRTGGFQWSTLSNLAGDDWETVIGPDDLVSDQVWSIAIDNESVWVGTSGGIIRNRAGIIDTFTTNKNYGKLAGSIVYDLEYDGDGNMWVATNKGLSRIDPEDNVESITRVPPLSSTNCATLVYDAEENVLWIGTEDGLARLNLTPPTPEPIPLTQMILYPNPIHVSRGDNALRIGRISQPVSVWVYTVEGELVHEKSGVREGEEAWDLLTLNGFKARSGVYIVRVSDGTYSEMKKIALIK